jgi:predicted TIM-barrel fold metal-dependent hydrolase
LRPSQYSFTPDDAHHHFINVPDFVYPWIEGRQPALTALLPNYYDAAHPYLPQEYRADVSAVPLTAAIACEFGAADGVAEAIWVQQCADRVGVPNAFIAAVQLDSGDLPTTKSTRPEQNWKSSRNRP